MIYLLLVQLVSLSFMAELWPFQRTFVLAPLVVSKISDGFRCHKTPEMQTQGEQRADEETKGWRGLVPLRAKRSDVDKLLGAPTDSRGRTEIYQTKTEKVEIWYSSGHCGDGQVWNVPRDVVIRIVITPETRVLVQDLRLSGYLQVKEAHPENWIQYWSPDGGIMVQAIRMDSAEEVLNLTYQPGKADESLRCRSGTKKAAKLPEPDPRYR